MLLSDFLSMTKVLRMLYGPRVAKEYFEKTVAEFGDFSLKDLQSYDGYAKIQPTHGN